MNISCWKYGRSERCLRASKVRAGLPDTRCHHLITEQAERFGLKEREAGGCQSFLLV